MAVTTDDEKPDPKFLVNGKVSGIEDKHVHMSMIDY